jgi:hypothetical protein
VSGQPQPASTELAALARAARPDWEQDAVWAALSRAHHTGLTWGQIYSAFGRMLADPEASPDELAHQAPKPWLVKRPPQPADTAHRGAALARGAAHHQVPPQGDEPR